MFTFQLGERKADEARSQVPTHSNALEAAAASTAGRQGVSLQTQDFPHLNSVINRPIVFADPGHLSRCLRDKSDVAYFANEPTKTLKISICNWKNRTPLLFPVIMQLLAHLPPAWSRRMDPISSTSRSVTQPSLLCGTSGAESHLRGDFCGGEGGDVTQESPARMHRLSGFRSDHTSPPHSLSLRVFSLPPSYYRDILVVLTCEVGSHVLSMGRVCRSPNESSSEAVVSCADSQIQLQRAFVHAIGVHKSVAVLQRPHLWWGLMDIVRFFHHHVFLLRNQFSSSSENLLGQVSWISRSEGTLVLANGYSIRSREPQETSRIRKFTARDCLSFMGSDTRRSAQKINHESLIYIRIYELRSFLINASKVLACVCRTQHSRKNREAGKLPDNLPEALIEKLSAHVLWAGSESCALAERTP
ncbi:hypothetical protein MJG53_019387 [Ovis ammon polii x Ovis aries]|uniref:Uncharacterized protein n=1 Tax=Ovis ammon polii x Ovis aries TaxID=2918886 RepID=A0ACB9U010_9CETA|nr:hypothetical protein MJG53_019387 [Ovis ammon polii x Ovis aries]